VGDCPSLLYCVEVFREYNMNNNTSMIMSNLALKANGIKPECRTGTFVNKKAPIMIIINGIVAFFTPLLTSINPPHISSTKATRYII
jgi:hypothetical protein